MSTFKLSMPTDIPWRRMCVTNDMLDPLACDDDRPPRWHSSLAAFRYDPVEDYQPFEDQLITYLKVVVTVAPFQWNEPGVTPRPDFVPEEIYDDVADSHPCYGAVLQVSIAPTATERTKFQPSQYPYFIDFEPKKRELYEAVSETGEVMSGSLSNVSVGKAVTDTHGTEDYNLDMGGGGGFGLGWGLVSADWGGQEQTGTVKRHTSQVQSVRSTDFSTERRELQSHTTQLTQMYNLFQAFHLGTNRAVFLMEPRPHIRQSEATFVNGPRAMEGMQEIFMVVVRPRSMANFCVGTLLETAHVTYTPVYDYKYDTLAKKLEMRPNLIGSDPVTVTVAAPSGWVVDTTKGSGGFVFTAQAGFDPQPTVSVTVAADLKSWTITADFGLGTLLFSSVVVNFTGFLRSQRKKKIETVRRLFMTARELCCCPPARYVAPGWVASEIDLSHLDWEVYVGPGGPQHFAQSREMAATIRNEMVRSMTSPRRHARGVLPYVDSDTFHVRVADVLRASPGEPRLALEAPVGQAAQLDEATRAQLAEALGDRTVADFLTGDTPTLTRLLGLDAAEVRELKRHVLRGLGPEPSSNDR